MTYANTNISEVPCTESKIQNATEPGIFDMTKETRANLIEILYMIDLFKREIRDYKIPTDEKAVEPTCFKDEVASIHGLAAAIRGDLCRLLDEFH